MEIEQAINYVKNHKTGMALAIDGKCISIIRIRKINGFDRLYYQCVSETYSDGHMIIEGDVPERLKELSWLTI